MRIVASACLVLALLFMVGCGTSAEDKKMITDQGMKLTTLEKSATEMGKAAVEMGKKVDAMADYLMKNPIGKAKFVYPPEEVKPPEPPKPGAAAKPGAKAETKPATPTTPATKGPAPTKTPATGKGG